MEQLTVPRAQGWLCALDIGIPVDTALALCPRETTLAFYPQTLHTKAPSRCH